MPDADWLPSGQSRGGGAEARRLPRVEIGEFARTGSALKFEFGGCRAAVQLYPISRLYLMLFIVQLAAIN